MLLVDAIIDDNIAINDHFGFEAPPMGEKLIVIGFRCVRSFFEHFLFGIGLDNLSIIDDGVNDSLVRLSKSTYMDVYV